MWPSLGIWPGKDGNGICERNSFLKMPLSVILLIAVSACVPLVCCTHPHLQHGTMQSKPHPCVLPLVVPTSLWSQKQRAECAQCAQIYCSPLWTTQLFFMLWSHVSGYIVVELMLCTVSVSLLSSIMKASPCDWTHLQRVGNESSGCCRGAGSGGKCSVDSRGEQSSLTKWTCWCVAAQL